MKHLITFVIVFLLSLAQAAASEEDAKKLERVYTSSLTQNTENISELNQSEGATEHSSFFLQAYKTRLGDASRLTSSKEKTKSSSK